MHSGYQTQVQYFLCALDIACDSLDYQVSDDTQKKHARTFYEMIRTMTHNPKPEHDNMASLKISIRDLLTYFQEASGPDVEYFWAQINDKNIPYERVNKLEKILKRKQKKLKDIGEYHYVIDTIVPFEQEGKITKEESCVLLNMIKDFEEKYDLE